MLLQSRWLFNKGTNWYGEPQTSSHLSVARAKADENCIALAMPNVIFCSRLNIELNKCISLSGYCSRYSVYRMKYYKLTRDIIVFVASSAQYYLVFIRFRVL